jgi:hypothetical protein
MISEISNCDSAGWLGLGAINHRLDLPNAMMITIWRAAASRQFIELRQQRRSAPTHLPLNACGATGIEDQDGLAAHEPSCTEERSSHPTATGRSGIHASAAILSTFFKACAQSARGSREQPLPCHFGARDLPLGDEFVEFALSDAEIVRCLLGYQQLEPCNIMHILANFLVFDISEPNTRN